MVWPTLGSRTAKQQNRTGSRDMLGIDIQTDPATHRRAHYNTQLAYLGDLINKMQDGSRN